jgi:hypothetical protein
MKPILFSAIALAFLIVATGCDEKSGPKPPYTGPVTPIQDEQKPPALPPAPK